MNNQQKRKKRYEKTIAEMTYLDDDFFTACLQNNPDAALLILRIVMRKPDLVFVKKPEIQHTIKNLTHKSIRLDLFCKSENRYYDVEIQRKDKGAGAHRARYYISVIDANLTVPGEDYDALPDVYVIFITQNDIPGRGEPFYEIERVNKTTGEDFGDGAHILYVNGAYEGDDDFGKLTHDFRCVNPHDIIHDELRKPAIFFKETEEGRKQMSEAVEKLVNEEVEANKKETAEKMIRNGKLSEKEIADISGLSVEQVEKIKDKVLATA